MHDVIQHILNGCVRFYISATQRLVLTCLTAKTSGAVIFLLMELFRIICKNKKQQKQCSSENGCVRFFIAATGCWPNTIALCTRVGLSPRLPVHTPYSEQL